MNHRIKNREYRRFLDEGLINLVTPDTIKEAIQNIKGKNAVSAKALLWVLYYTGCRPAEALLLMPDDIKKEGRHLAIYFKKTLKNGLPRPFFVPMKREGAVTILNYASRVHPSIPLFYQFKGSYKRAHTKKSGEIVTYNETSGKLRYHFKKWFGFMDDPIPPYFLRHNRFSQLTMANVSA